MVNYLNKYNVSYLSIALLIFHNSIYMPGANEHMTISVSGINPIDNLSVLVLHSARN